MLSGVLFLLCCAAIVFWATTTLDLGWFELQKLELPVGLRAILLAVLLPSGLLLLAVRVVFPVFRRLRDSDIALLVERRFPQFQDRLITTVESSKGIADDGPLVKPMLERSAREADSIAGNVASDDVFDASNLKRLGLMSGGLMLSVAVFGIASPQSLTRWWNAFVRCDEIYYQRTTDLVLHAVSQPGDRRIAFKPIDGQLIDEQQQLTYRHSRGADLELVMTVPDGGPREGQSWRVPDRVRVDLIRVDGSRSRTYVSATSDRTFRFVVTRLQEPVEIGLLAGDYRTRTPYRVDVVNPPGIDQVQLFCTYPEYTGWNQLRERTLTITGSEIQLPIGTSFEFVAGSSKPLQAVRVVSDYFELSGDRDSSRLMLRDEQASANSGSAALLSADGRQIKARMVIVAPVSTTSDAPTAVSDAASAPEVDDSILQIPSNASLRFFLHDEDDVMSASPETLRVQGIPDGPPVIIAQMKGVGNAVTRLARIPVAGRIRDDYGLKSASFEFLVDDETRKWRPRPFRQVPGVNSTDFDLQRSDDEPFEIFDLQPLELTDGQTLTLSVVASDDNQMPAPAVTRSEPLLFRIVSNEELLSLLYTREISLRNRFEEVIAQLEEVRDDLQFHSDVARRVDAAATAASAEDRASLNTSATRSGNNLRRQTNELNSIVEGFEEIAEQLENNAIPQQPWKVMRELIVAPLQQVTDDLIPAADRAVSTFRVAAMDSQPSESLVNRSSEKVSDVITSLKLILENVRDMAEFHELLKEGKAIEDKLEELMQNMKDLQKRELLEKLKGL